MRLSEQFCDAQHWVTSHFGWVQLGDARRCRRVCKLVASWVCQPGASITHLGAGVAYGSKAAYRLLNQLGAALEVLQAPHRQEVTAQLQQLGTYLLVEGTTQLRWSWAGAARPGLEPVGITRTDEQGILLHSLVAAR